MDSPPRKRRITVKLKHPNPLFEKWLMEWRDEAIEKNSKMQFCFAQALDSLRKYPIPLESGKDCGILKGFGKKLCEMLDKKLEEHKQRNSDGESGSGLRRLSVQREYVPQYRSGAYAILLTLFRKSRKGNYCGYMMKSDLTKEAQSLCDVSFTRPDPGSFYTAWSSMGILCNKGLVIKKSCPAKYSLTREGELLGERLDMLDSDENVQQPELPSLPKNNSRLNTDKNVKQPELPSPLPKHKAISKIPDKPNSQSSEDKSDESASQEETIILTPGSFDVVLLVDTSETTGGTRNLNDETIAELSNLNIVFELRRLNVSDFAWICRKGANELVLPYVVERKRMDDLGSSIKDGRFHEQKFRLKQCGIQNLIYLVESYGQNTHVGLPLSTLYQAATNTLVQDGFTVKFTENHHHSMAYLATITKALINMFQNKTVISCPRRNLEKFIIDDDIASLMTFREFNRGATKSRKFRVSEMFIRHLLQIKGLSVEKALAIAEKYPTPKLLQQAYLLSGRDGEKLLASLRYGKLGKTIGPVVSKTVYQLYTNEKLL